MSEEKKPRILVVDRRMATLTSLNSLLGRKGYDVTTCSSSAEALEAVAGRRRDLVIAGTDGPERPGAALVSRIKTLSPETSVLLLTESDDDSVADDAVAAGADGLLRRSYSGSQVIQRVEQLLHAVQTQG